MLYEINLNMNSSLNYTYSENNIHNSYLECIMALSKTIRNNIRSLNSKNDRLAGDTKEKATELRDLYELRKSAQAHSLAPHQLLLVKANDESWTVDVMLYREGVREGDNKKASFTYKIPTMGQTEN